MRIPSSTYRLQFNSAFQFKDATRILEYLRELGISDVYCSPLLKARKGSIHGYDVTDPTKINPEIGSHEDFELFVRRLRENHLNLILDIVPNHMAASLENPWWVGVLANGQSSPYATFFDIDWSAGAVLLPILGKPYGEVLESAELFIQDGKLRYFDHTLPVRTEMKDVKDIDELDRILSKQAYRLAYWRKAADAINYRRFFDINDLVGLRAEREDVFNATHALILDLVKRGVVHGLRIDHIDGLLEPKSYLNRLPQIYVVVEKVLGGRESLPQDWRTNGTTGYDFLNIVNGVFIDSEGYHKLRHIYSEFTGSNGQIVDVFRGRKRQAVKDLFTGEVGALTDRLIALAQLHRYARDLTRDEIQEALVSVTACLPVYRTYVRDFSVSETDRQTIVDALEAANCPPFLREVLLLEPPYYMKDRRGECLDFVMHWQQFTGPVMAKGLEDTTFYAHNPLISVNEVGGDSSGPEVFFGVEAFHRRNLSRQRTTMNASSTHDTKRSEDVRARIDVLSELPEEWERRLTRWSKWNPSDSAPDRNEQILIYQTLVGAWPISRERLHPYLIKALREGKTHTSWLKPESSYEEQALAFVDRLMDPQRSKPFLEDFRKFQRKIAYFGALNSLGQTLLKITAPGVPDFYQGTELWDYSLADPDNRRPVDYAFRIRMLESVKHAKPQELMSHWEDGAIKIFTIWKALAFRRDHRQLFDEGEYVPLEVTGKHAGHVIAFIRRLGDDRALIVVPRLTSHITRPGKAPAWRLRTRVTGECSNSMAECLHWQASPVSGPSIQSALRLPCRVGDLRKIGARRGRRS